MKWLISVSLQIKHATFLERIFPDIDGLASGTFGQFPWPRQIQLHLLTLCAQAIFAITSLSLKMFIHYLEYFDIYLT
jgi:hypothetical protein